MTQVSTTAVIGDNYVVVSGEVTSGDPGVGWPGSADVEQVFLTTSKGEQVDITELIYSVLAQGSDIWTNLAQKLVEED